MPSSFNITKSDSSVCFDDLSNDYYESQYYAKSEILEVFSTFNDNARHCISKDYDLESEFSTWDDFSDQAFIDFENDL